MAGPIDFASVRAQARVREQMQQAAQAPVQPAAPEATLRLSRPPPEAAAMLQHMHLDPDAYLLVEAQAERMHASPPLTLGADDDGNVIEGSMLILELRVPLRQSQILLPGGSRELEKDAGIFPAPPTAAFLMRRDRCSIPPALLAQLLGEQAAPDNGAADVATPPEDPAPRR